MLRSMTGFSSKEQNIPPFGKVSIELRSANHKFLEVAFRLPEGFLPLEDKIRRAIESRVKRGRVTCVLNISDAKSLAAGINKNVLKMYVHSFKKLQKELGLEDRLRLESLITLPGVLSCQERRLSPVSVWPKIRPLVVRAVDVLQKAREKEGRALSAHLKKRQLLLCAYLGFIKARGISAVKRKLQELNSDEERSLFLKSADIAEEIERLSFHIKNLKSRLHKNKPVGKELDFIAQEMQREANTLGAKTFDTLISAKVIQIKSQVEKIREQAQNIE